MTEDMFQMRKGANLSPDRLYRYSLWRIWDDSKPFVLFIGLNPSTADEDGEDHTTNKLTKFTEKWGYGGFYIVNLFGIIETESDEMKKHSSPVGNSNDDYILALAKRSELIVPMWGLKGKHLDQDKHMLTLLKEYVLYCFKKNTDGTPAHPARLAYKTEIQIYEGCL